MVSAVAFDYVKVHLEETYDVKSCTNCLCHRLVVSTRRVNSSSPRLSLSFCRVPFFFGYFHKRNAHRHVVTSEHVYCFHVKKINLVEIHRGVYANVVRTEPGSALLHTGADLGGGCRGCAPLPPR